MSDEFFKIATAEINDEISQIQSIVDSCKNRLDMYSNAEKIQKSTHKIKGLAPMMGKEDLGSLAALLDSILKKITSETLTDEVFDTLTCAIAEMKNSMTTSDYTLDDIKQKVLKISSSLFWYIFLITCELSLRMANIMIADDSDAIRLVLRDILTIDDHAIVSEAKDGQEAIDKFPQVNPDLMLLDLAMPKKDGLSVVKEIIAQNPTAKIVLITASDDQKIIQQCLDSGASSYISKPFDFNNVLKTVSDILAK